MLLSHDDAGSESGEARLGYRVVLCGSPAAPPGAVELINRAARSVLPASFVTRITSCYGKEPSRWQGHQPRGW